MITKKEREYINDIYSNFDHCYECNKEDVRSHPNKYFQHSAWNFCGYIWYNIEDKRFYEEVWCYNSHVETLKADTLEDLISKVNDKYGYE